MKRKFAFVLGTALATGMALSFSGAVLAQGHQSSGQSGMMGGGMMSNGQMGGGMMSMHRNMMGGGMMGPHMMGPEFRALMDADGDGKAEPAEARARLQELLDEHDENADGTLSISEFEVLHSRLIRETMVDRFQHLDSDGDGNITAEEMAAPVKRMEHMQKRMEMMRQSSGNSGQGMGSGSMMQGGQDHRKK